MASLFGRAWTSYYGAKPDGIGGDTWAVALAGFSPAQIAQGLRGLLLLGSDFPPSAPKFRALCFGIPSFLSVRLEILGLAAARSPFTRQVWSSLDAFRWKQAPSDAGDRMLREAYDEAVDFVMRGGRLPVESEAIAKDPEKPRTPATPETVAAEIEAMITALDERP